MADIPYPTDDSNDLPRTVRQQKEARARDQMAREILNAPRPAYAREVPAPPPAQQPAAAAQFMSASPMSASLAADAGRAESYASQAYASQAYPSTASLPPGEYPATAVKRFEVPFFHLAGFFLKCAVAAIPALMLLGGILWALGHLAQTYLPWLIKMQMLITFPG